MPKEPAWGGGEAAIDFKAGQMFLSHDRDSNSFYLQAHERETELFQLGAYLKEYVGKMSAEERAQESLPKEPAWGGGEAAIDFKAGQMFLSHDRDSNSFYLQAHERETDEEQPESEVDSVSFWITLGQATELAEESLRICASGRPICFLCGQPINPEGHVCPRANGHTVLEAG